VRHALRQDPDVIVLSELREAELAALALEAAEIGHLVLASMPTVSAIDTVERFVELFPLDRQVQARSSLAATLRAIVSQRLLPRAGGRGRVPAVEVLVGNARVAQRIREPGRLHELQAEMEQGDLYGMQCNDASVLDLYRNGLISRVDAVAAAREPSEMRFSLDRADFDRSHGGAPSAPRRPCRRDRPPQRLNPALGGADSGSPGGAGAPSATDEQFEHLGERADVSSFRRGGAPTTSLVRRASSWRAANGSRSAPAGQAFGWRPLPAIAGGRRVRGRGVGRPSGARRPCSACARRSVDAALHETSVQGGGRASASPAAA
jgi:twitching motility protein PilT